MSSPINWQIPTAAAGGIAGIGLIAVFWENVKLWGSKLTSTMIVSEEVNGFNAVMAVKMLLMSEFKCSPLGKKWYGGLTEFVRPVGRSQLVVMERVPTEPTLWWRGGKVVLVSSKDEFMSISFIRGMFGKDDLLIEAVTKYNAQNHEKNWRSGDRFFIRRKTGSIGKDRSNQNNRPSGGEGNAEIATKSGGDLDKRFCRPLQWKRNELGEPKNASPMDALCLTAQQLEAVQEAVRWRDSELWFKGKGVPWKRGWMLEGGVGTGKTAFTRALGQELNMPIMSFDLATMTNQDFIEAWDETMSRTPCISLFEDIDAVFDKRKNIAVQGGLSTGLSFDCLLNSLDGVESTDGCFVIVTTNNIEKVDPAIGIPTNGDEMSSRPGRIDRVIKFAPLSHEGKIKMAKRILGDFPETEWDHLLIEEKERTGAQFQDACSRLALRLFWEKQGENDEATSV